MNPADLYCNDSTLKHNGDLRPSEQGLDSPSLVHLVGTSNGLAKGVKNISVIQRIDTEGIYTRLKAAIGEHWEDYKDALGAFLLGKIGQGEFTRVLSPLLSSTHLPNSDPLAPRISTLHLHNTLIAALYANALYRDAPVEAVAPWVLATDTPLTHSAAKAAASAGSGASNQVEERIKREVMALSGRDRRRIKAVKDTLVPHASMSTTATRATKDDAGLLEAKLYRELLEPVPRSTAGTLTTTSAAGGKNSNSTAGSSTLAKTNFDLEIKRRFAAPMACESLEFPSRTEIQARLEPICYEEGINGGVASAALQACAELVETAAETYIKETLETWLGVVRRDSAGLVQTARYKSRLRREERLEEEQQHHHHHSAHLGPLPANVQAVNGASHLQTQHRPGDMVRNALGLLPVEAASVAAREPLAIEEVRLALQLDNNLLRPDPFLGHDILSNGYIDAPGTEVIQTNGVGHEVKTGIAEKVLDGLAHTTPEMSTPAHKIEPAPAPRKLGPVVDGDAMLVDEQDWGWTGATASARNGLMDVLNGVLAVGS